EGIAQTISGIQYVIEQADLAKIKVARKMKTKKIVPQGARNELQKLYLTADRQADIVIFDLLLRHTSLRHQWFYIDPGFDRVRAGETRNHAASAAGHADR